MVGTTNKSMAAMSGAWLRRNCASNSLINWCTMKVRRLTL